MAQCVKFFYDKDDKDDKDDAENDNGMFLFYINEYLF